MSLEATSDDPKNNPKPKRRNTRGGNPLVDEALAAAEEGGETAVPPTEGGTSVEDEAVLEAQRNFVAPVSEPQEEPAAEPPPPAGGEYNPFERHAAVPPTPTRKAAREDAAADRARANKGTPSTKKLGELGKKLPGAERAKVHKRLETGALAYIGEYTEGDLTQSQDMESFLNKYVKPTYGAGEYQLTGVDAYGRTFDMGYITLLAPLPGAPAPETVLQQPDTTLGNITRTLVDRALAPQPAPRTPDPIQMLTQLHDLQEKMNPKKDDGSKDNSLLLAVVGGLTTIGSALVTVLAQPKAPDPIMALLLRKLEEPPPRPVAVAPPPPPPPPPDPTEQLKNLAEVMRSMRPETPAAVGDDRLITYLMQERMTPADVLKLVNEVKGERGTDDFKKSMENIGIMLNAVNQLRAHTEPSGGSGFWEALANMAQNRELGGVLADVIRNKRQGPEPQPQQLPPQQQHRALPALTPDDPLVVQAREQAQKRLDIEKKELEARERALQGGGAPQPAATPEATAAAPATAEKQPSLPPNIADHINALLEAEDDAALVNETINMLFSFMESPEWKPFAEMLFDHIHKGEKKEFLHRMAQTFMGLQTLKLIELKLGQRVMKALSENFNTVAEVLKAQLEALNKDDEGGEEGEEEDDDEENDVLKLGNEDPLPIP